MYCFLFLCVCSPMRYSSCLNSTNINKCFYIDGLFCRAFCQSKKQNFRTCKNAKPRNSRKKIVLSNFQICQHSAGSKILFAEHGTHRMYFVVLLFIWDHHVLIFKERVRLYGINSVIAPIEDNRGIETKLQ